MMLCKGGGNHVDYGKSVHHTHNSMATPLSVAKRTKQVNFSPHKTLNLRKELKNYLFIFVRSRNNFHDSYVKSIDYFVEYPYHK